MPSVLGKFPCLRRKLSPSSCVNGPEGWSILHPPFDDNLNKNIVNPKNKKNATVKKPIYLNDFSDSLNYLRLIVSVYRVILCEFSLSERS